MMTPEELLTRLSSTRFAGRPHVVLERSGGAAVAVQLAPDEARDAWLEARALTDATGRWPVAITTWPMKEPSWEAAVADILSPAAHAGDDRPSVEAILKSAATLDLDAALAELEGNDWEEWLAETPDGDLKWAASAMAYWFDPSPKQPTAMVFLPSPHPWASVAYEPWYAEDAGTPAPVLVALLERWNETYGAEPMAHWGTMLQLRVDRPPTSLDAARALAREQLLVAPCTALLPGTHPERHAEALMQVTTWFLHERP
ncbi:MAG: DUF4253 domain-containing protein [Polyangiales bacterium]